MKIFLDPPWTAPEIRGPPEPGQPPGRKIGEAPDRHVTGIRKGEGVVLLRREEGVVKLAIGVGGPARGA